MNEPNSTLQRLKRKLVILDAIDEQAYRCNAEMMQFESTCDNMPVVLCAGEFAGVRQPLQQLGRQDGWNPFQHGTIRLLISRSRRLRPTDRARTSRPAKGRPGP